MKALVDRLKCIFRDVHVFVRCGSEAVTCPHCQKRVTLADTRCCRKRMVVHAHYVPCLHCREEKHEKAVYSCQA